MRGVAIVSPVRTAVGNFGGGLRDISAAELGFHGHQRRAGTERHRPSPG